MTTYYVLVFNDTTKKWREVYCTGAMPTVAARRAASRKRDELARPGQLIGIYAKSAVDRMRRQGKLEVPHAKV